MRCTVPGTRVYCSARNIDTLSTDEGFSGFLPSFQKGKVYYSKQRIMKCLHFRGWLSMTICWLGKKLESVVRTYRASVWAKNKGGPGPFPSIRHWSELRGLNLDSLEKLCNGLFPRTNKTVRNDEGGGGGVRGTRKLIFVTPWPTIFHFGVRESSCTEKLFCAS